MRSTFCKAGMVVLFFTVFHPGKLSAQADTVLTIIEYKFTHVIDTTQPDRPLSQSYALMMGKNLSKFTAYSNAMYDLGTPETRKADDGTGKMVTVIIGGSGGEDPIFKNLAANKLTTLSVPERTYYRIEETIPEINWTISMEQKQLKEYTCQKATTSFRGRNYTAWFTTQIANQNGPSKLGGLPGLILEAYDDKHEVVYEFLSLIIPAAGLEPIVIKEGLPVTREQFKKLKTALQKDANALKGASSVSVRDNNIVATSVPMNSGDNRKARVWNNPIEKDK